MLNRLIVRSDAVPAALAGFPVLVSAPLLAGLLLTGGSLRADPAAGAPVVGGTALPAAFVAVQDGSGADDAATAQEEREAPDAAPDEADGDADGDPAQPTPQRFVRARSGGVTVRNLADVHGVPLADVRADGLMAVYGESAGWLEVDVPGGLPVWVFGRYLREVEGVEGVLEVTHNNVNMRPRAGSDVNNFPLTVRLVAGDQVAVIAREDPDAPLAETWVRIWAPPGACGWVQTERTEPLADGIDGAAIWSAAETALASGGAPTGRGRAQRSSDASEVGVTEATAPVGTVAAREALATADELFMAERGLDRPDFASMRDAYERVRALDPDGELATIVAGKLDTVGALEEVWRTRMLLEEERVERQREQARRQREQWERLRERDPFYGHFAVRGELQRFQGSDGAVSYRVVRGGVPRAAVRCTSGRFELDLFVGREVGLDGGFQIGADAAAGLSPEAAAFVADLPAIDLASIEILD